MKQKRIFIGDFETTVYVNQTDTQVWASALVELGCENVLIHHSIWETFDWLVDLKENVTVYYHNLKFDGAFWLSYLLVDLDMEQAYDKITESAYKWLKNKDMPKNSVKYVISDMGAWYTITIKTKHGKIIEIRDSLKLLPFSVKRIGKSFATKHKKLEMEYTGFRYPGCVITDEEKKYLANDVLVVKEALEIMFEEGHNRLTIGSCCVEEFKNIFGKNEYDTFMPQLSDMEIDFTQYGADTVDAYVRKSYHGGWCYLVHGKENKIYHNGVTADVNSLYPSMMSSESGNKYPVSTPKFWKGDMPKEAIHDNKYFFVRFKCRFDLKEGYLPFIQIKDSKLYKSNECLETSSVYNEEDDTYYRYYEYKGQLYDTKVELTMTCTDWYLFNEHYNIYDLEVLDGCWFWAESGIFDGYMEKYKKIKIESKGAKRELAKLFLNNLYGKMATNPKSDFKIAYVKDDKSLGFISIPENNKTAGYIPIGSAITSYARNFTIRTAQKNYHGKDKPGFIYADTDSIHCDIPENELVDVPVHPTDFCHWKLESSWDTAIFARQKTYIEHVTHEDLEPVEKPYYNIKCAGMPEKCKDLLRMSIEGETPEDTTKYTEEEIKFLSVKRTLKDFKNGLIVPGKLLPKRIKGGVLLTDTTFEMR